MNACGFWFGAGGRHFIHREPWVSADNNELRVRAKVNRITSHFSIRFHSFRARPKWKIKIKHWTIASERTHVFQATRPKWYQFRFHSIALDHIRSFRRGKLFKTFAYIFYRSRIAIKLPHIHYGLRLQTVITLYIYFMHTNHRHLIGQCNWWIPTDWRISNKTSSEVICAQRTSDWEVRRIFARLLWATERLTDWIAICFHSRIAAQHDEYKRR